MIVALVTTAVFLPVRLLFYTYVSHAWLGNLGVMSVIAIGMFILIEKNKLGWFGRMFKNRVRRLVFHKIFWVAVFGGIMNVGLWAFFLYEIDKGEFEYETERHYIVAITIVAEQTNGTGVINSQMPVTQKTMANSIRDLGLFPPDEIMAEVSGWSENQTKDWMRDMMAIEDGAYFMDVLFSVVLYIINLEYGAWGSHFLTVILVEEIEALALLFFYRKVYFKRVGESWQVLGYNKNIKKLAKKGKLI